MKFHIITFGCQMNRSDSERITAVLAKKGNKQSLKPQGADLVIVNMCSVRQKSVDKAINRIQNAKRKMQNDKLKCKIIATGCILEKDKKALKKLGVEIKNFKGLEKMPPQTALVPIARGCNNFCSYCAVPFTRGREKYRSQKRIIDEAKELVQKGYQEITLLGQNVNSYPNFVKLLQNITKLKGDFKIRFITNHPKDLSDELIHEMAHNPKIKKQIHLPFQAGDNVILRKMNRKYTREHYLRLIDKLKQAMPDIVITTDVIVGFPGETKKQFQKTLDIIKRVGFKQVFIGKYSPRPGTMAAKLKDNVTLAEKKLREQTILNLIKNPKPQPFEVEPPTVGARLPKPALKPALGKIAVILGPTGSGKTALSIKLAKKFNGEIVSADSRQVFREMDIGTGKITKKEMQGIPHHLLDTASPKRKFSATQYQTQAIEVIDEIIKRNKIPFLVGGSPFYIYSVTDGWQFPAMKKNPKLRRQLEKKSTQELFKMLGKLDPRRAKTIEAKNKRRLIRAIEIAKALGSVPQIKKTPKYDCLLIGIDVPKELLIEKINKRVDQMISQGLEKEVKSLIKKYGKTSVLRDSIDYGEWLPYFEKKITKDEVVSQIKKNHLRLVKHQMTWFRHNKNIRWVQNQRMAEKLIKGFLN